MARASGQSPQNGVAIGFGERFADSAGNDPRGMNSLATQPLDDFLPKLAQTDSVEREFGILLGDAKYVAFRRVGIHAEEQIGRGKVKETERVGLRHLRQSEDAAQFFGGRGMRTASKESQALAEASGG